LKERKIVAGSRELVLVNAITAQIEEEDPKKIEYLNVARPFLVEIQYFLTK
jgi:hypothetical protein